MPAERKAVATFASDSEAVCEGGHHSSILSRLLFGRDDLSIKERDAWGIPSRDINSRGENATGGINSGERRRTEQSGLKGRKRPRY